MHAGPEPAAGPPPAAHGCRSRDRAGPRPDSVAALKVDGASLLLADVGGTLLAYVNQCASCGETISEAELAGGMLRCPACEIEFDLPRAGRAAGGEPLQLRPVPLLEAGGLRVAI